MYRYQLQEKIRELAKAIHDAYTPNPPPRGTAAAATHSNTYETLAREISAYATAMSVCTALKPGHIYHLPGPGTFFLTVGHHGTKTDAIELVELRSGQVLSSTAFVSIADKLVLVGPAQAVLSIAEEGTKNG